VRSRAIGEVFESELGLTAAMTAMSSLKVEWTDRQLVVGMANAKGGGHCECSRGGGEAHGGAVGSPC
jgi:hypothetical protein